MALTLADSFLNDLDELEAEDEEDQEEAGEQEEGDEEEEEEEEDLEAVLESKLGGAGLSGAAKSAPGEETVWRLRKSEAYGRHMGKIAEFEAGFSQISRPTEHPAQPEEGNAEYAVIVESNDVLSKIDEEVRRVYRFVADTYGSKFPELETLVPDMLDYARVVETMGNEMDMTQVDLTSILPPTAVMVVSVTGSTTSGSKLADADLEKCLAGCAEMLGLDADRRKLLEYLESRMSSIAPNVAKLVGASLAAMLVGAAGGLEKLAAVPACNLTVLGQDRRRTSDSLGGFGSAVGMPHTGILYFSELVQAAPHAIRRKVLKIVAAKTALAARVDAHGRKADKTTAAADNFVLQVKAKIELLCAPPKAQKVKALPAPDVGVVKKRRGGKRVRKAKDRLRVTELRGLANKRAFGADTFGAEYGDDAMGNDFGLLGQEGAGVRAAPVADTRSQNPAKRPPQNTKKQRKAVELSASATSGLSSSLVFTPVQGIELANPAAAAEKVAAANEKWFSAASGFQSALTTNKAPGGLTF